MKLSQQSIVSMTMVILLITLFSCQDKGAVSSENEKTAVATQEHPNLILTVQGVKDIRAQLGKIPVFDKTLAKVKAEIDAEIESGIETPIPLDYSGGYTHARHKRNFLVLQKAGVLYQILEDEKYAKYVKDMLMQYEAMYKTLPVHPKTRSYARGKLFWQCLNDSNWLVYVSQAYDCIYNYLSEEERNKLETNLFRPFADYISIENIKFYNRVHNHSTWGNAAVGMIGLAMNDEELIQRALYGINDADIDSTLKDDDGGFIYTKGKAGFLANLEEPFSPDGYYTEGPYYQRYAMYPFLIFAEGLENVRPDLKIFEYKDGVLLKSVHALLNLSDANGEFFPLNDGQKGMSYYSRELVTAVDIAYHHGNQDPGLLSIAKEQDQVLLDDSGFSVALGIKNGKEEPFVKKSINLSDGSDGKQGGVGILRSSDLELVFKYAAQGLSHGHYDKLSYSLYEGGDEVIQDYGLARFVNIEQKGGGNYLKENKTWAKQTIAHNTITQNEGSHFSGKYEIGSQHHSELFFYDDSNPVIQIVSAKEVNAYPGTSMHRTMALISDKDFEKPFLLDLFKVDSETKNQYDLPFYYLGQMMLANFKYSTPSKLEPLGKANGYQHIWSEGTGVAGSSNTKFSWLNQNRFYSLTMLTSENDELILGRVGANDPEFNLRRDASLMLRKNETKDHTFVSIIESHGSYSPVSEFAVNAYSNIEQLKLVVDKDDYTAVSIITKNEKEIMVMISNKDNSKETSHTLSVGDETYKWQGPYHIVK